MKDSFVNLRCVRILFVGICVFLLGENAEKFDSALISYALEQQTSDAPTPEAETKAKEDALKKALNDFLAIEPPVLTQSSFDAQQRKALESTLEDSKTLMELTSDPEVRLWAAELRLRALLAHTWIKVPDSFSQLRELNTLASLLKSTGKHEALVRQVEYRILLFSIGMINTEKEDAPNPFKVKAAVKNYINENPKQLETLSKPMVQAAKNYGIRNKDFTLETLQEFSELYMRTGFLNDREEAANLAKVLKRFEMIGSPMPIKANDLQNEPLSMHNYRNKIVLIDFYAAWCAPCVADLPKLQGLYAKYHSKGFEIIGISADKSREDALGFARKNRIPWKIIFDASATPQLSQQYGISEYPTMTLIGRNGKVIATDFTIGALEKELEKLMFGYSGMDSFAAPAPNPLLESGSLKIDANRVVP